MKKNFEKFQKALKMRDNRPKREWWAPGDYCNTCNECGIQFIGDKRAGHCADCAYSNSNTIKKV